MTDYKLLSEAFVYLFYASGVVGVLFILEIVFGESVRGFLSRSHDEDDAEVGHE
jgi:hypothetical protein